MDKRKEQDAPLTLEERFHSGKRRRDPNDESTADIDVNRRLVFFICLVGGLIFTMGIPIIGVPLLLAAATMILATYKDPNCPVGDPDNKIFPDDSAFALVEGASLLRENMKGKPDVRSLKQSDDYDKFIDVLIKGGVIDANTEEDEIKLTVISNDPPTFELELYQIGKTERQLVAACESALFAYDAYVVEVKEIGGTKYRISYLLETEIETLSGMGEEDENGYLVISYDEVVDLYLAGGKYDG